MSDPAIAFAVLGAVIVLFVWNRLPVEVVALGSALTLFATGILTLPEVFAGFGDPTVIFIASLFVVSEGLDAAGVPAWAGQRLIALAGAGRTRLLIFTMLMVALLTALISVNGAVAALLSMVVVVAVRLNHSPSQLLLPLAFAAHAGSLLALTGTPINVIASESLEEVTGERFAFFEFGLVGVPLLLGTMAIALFFGPRLLPHRVAKSVPADLSQHASTLINHYRLPDDHVAGELMTPDMGVAEVVVSPRSALVGDFVFPGMVTPSGDLVILAVQRRGDDLGPSGATLEAGDTLLVQGRWEALSRNVDGNPEVLAVDSLETVRRQAVPLGRKAREAIVILVAMVVLLALGVTSPAVVGLLAAGAMILSRVLSVEQAYRGISWTTVVIVGGMFPMSAALQQTGAADQMANALVDVVGGWGPRALLLGLFVMTAVLGQLISNTATALIVIPIALSAAAELDISAQPVLMSVTVACAAAFLTPVATPANMMVMGPGGYEFGDYWKLGLPMLLWFMVVAVFVVPLFWSF